MEINQLIKVINGMLYMAEKEENPDDWTKDFLKDIKSVLEEHQEKI